MKLLPVLVAVMWLIAVDNAGAGTDRARFRSCRPAIGFDIKVSGASCRLARRVVRDSFVKSKAIPGTHDRGFTLDGFRCRVTQMGSEDKPIPARYRCRRRHVVLTWAYHP